MADEKKIEEVAGTYCKLTDKGAIFNDPIQGISFTGGKLIQKVKRTSIIAQGIQRGQLIEVTEKEFNEWEQTRAAYVSKAKEEELAKALEKHSKQMNKDKVIQNALSEVEKAKAEAEEAKAALEEVTKKNKKKDDKEDK